MLDRQKSGRGLVVDAGCVWLWEASRSDPSPADSGGQCSASAVLPSFENKLLFNQPMSHRQCSDGHRKETSARG